jgi:hypothetical protein
VHRRAAATVSNVLRNPKKVRPETAVRVLRAIRELGDRPNHPGGDNEFLIPSGGTRVQPFFFCGTDRRPLDAAFGVRGAPNVSDSFK